MMASVMGFNSGVNPVDMPRYEAVAYPGEIVSEGMTIMHRHFGRQHNGGITLLPYINAKVDNQLSFSPHKMARFINFLYLVAVVSVASALTVSDKRATGGYVQNPSGTASFTMYSGCGSPACGRSATGFTAAISQLSFGSAPGSGAGDACGRCFSITGTQDPYSPSFTGPFGKSIVVKVTDLCPAQGNEEWCGQSESSPLNQHQEPVHFDICEDTGGSAQFFPSGHGALTGTFTEVSCSQWSGSDGGSLWTGSCLSGETAANWPAVGCGNQGTAP